MTGFFSRLEARARQIDSLLCVGLDPHTADLAAPTAAAARDFCLRLIERGLQNWYMPGAELYHLEAQSYPAEFRKRATAYNIWLHTHLWGDQIEEVSASYPGPGEPAA